LHHDVIETCYISRKFWSYWSCESAYLQETTETRFEESTHAFIHKYILYDLFTVHDYLMSFK